MARQWRPLRHAVLPSPARCSWQCAVWWRCVQFVTGAAARCTCRVLLCRTKFRRDLYLVFRLVCRHGLTRRDSAVCVCACACVRCHAMACSVSLPARCLLVCVVPCENARGFIAAAPHNAFTVDLQPQGSLRVSPTSRTRSRDYFEAFQFHHILASVLVRNGT